MTQNPIFVPAQVGRAGEDVALQIEAAIINGKIQPGERLPSERKLQEQFRTGRGVVREALRTLKQKGLIEIKIGARGGAVVKQLELSNVSESLALFLRQNQINPEHLIEFRESIDRTITLLAIARANSSQKKSLLDKATRLKAKASQPDPDMGLLGETDRELNIYLAKMTGNPIFEWIMDAIQLGYSSQDNALYQDSSYRQMTVDNWQKTAALIAANEPLQALASISSHYVFLRKCLKEKESPQTYSAKEGFWRDN